MQNLYFDKKKVQEFRVLCLGSHSDDIEIGCGGTILKIIDHFENPIFHWVVFGSDEERKREAEESAKAFLRRVNKKVIIIENFRDGFFPYNGNEIKEQFERIKQYFKPDLIFTHYRSDLHQDHRLISDLTYNTFRDHLILEYEIPKYDGDLGSPNLFVPMQGSVCNRKIKHILKYFKTQSRNHWFCRETFQSLMRLRGMESNSRHHYAEAFYCRKIIVSQPRHLQ